MLKTLQFLVQSDMLAYMFRVKLAQADKVSQMREVIMRACGEALILKTAPLMIESKLRQV